jgi:hypothetical protein
MRTTSSVEGVAEVLNRVLALTAASTLALAFMTGTASAADNRGTHICLTGNKACLNLKNDNFSDADYPVVLYGPKGKGLGWQLAKDVCGGGACGKARPFAPGTGLNSKYNGRPIYVIWKTRGSKRDGCIVDNGGDGVAFTADWVKFKPGQRNSWCGGNGPYRWKGLWVYSKAHFLASVGFSYDDEGAVQPGIMSTNTTSSGTLIALDNPSNEKYQKWTL